MLGHDEIRVDEHIERYTQSQVATMWKSYLSDGDFAMDHVENDKNAAMKSAPTFEDLGMR